MQLKKEINLQCVTSHMCYRKVAKALCCVGKYVGGGANPHHKKLAYYEMLLRTSELRPVVGCCEYSNEPSGSIKGGEFASQGLSSMEEGGQCCALNSNTSIQRKL
jgi:hypothetical protein